MSKSVQFDLLLTCCALDILTFFISCGVAKRFRSRSFCYWINFGKITSYCDQLLVNKGGIAITFRDFFPAYNYTSLVNAIIICHIGVFQISQSHSLFTVEAETWYCLITCHMATKLHVTRSDGNQLKNRRKGVNVCNHWKVGRWWFLSSR